MELNTDLWYVRWFFWSCDVLDCFTKTDEKRRWGGTRRTKFESKGTTLCQFIRTIGWGILLYTLQLLVYALTLYVFVIKPFLLFSAASILTLIGVAVGSIAGVIGVILALWWSIKITVDVMEKYLANKPSPTPTDKPGFVKVMWEFIKAEKRKICPIIQFTETPKVGNIVSNTNNVLIEQQTENDSIGGETHEE